MVRWQRGRSIDGIEKIFGSLVISFVSLCGLCFSGLFSISFHTTPSEPLS